MYRISKVLATLFLLAVSVCSASAQTIKPPRGFEGKLAKATFSLYGHLPGSPREHFLCTATAYEKIKGGYRLISAGHCVQDSPAGALFEVSEIVGGPLVPVHLVKSRDEGVIDFSVFELISVKKYPVISLGTTSGLRVGDKVVDVHFSEGAAKQVSDGKVASQLMDSPEKCGSCPGRYLVQIFAGPGASGSAIVLKKNHKIIAILRGGFESNIGAIVTPISNFQEFLSKPDQVVTSPEPEKQAEHPLGPVD